MKLHRCAVALVGAALTGGLAACGGGSDSGTPSLTSTSTSPSSTIATPNTSATASSITGSSTTASSTPAAPTSTTTAANTTTTSAAPSSSSSGKTLTTPPPANDSKAASPSAALESAVRSYSGFYTGGKGSAAYAMLSARCQKLYSESLFSAVVQQVHQGYGTTPIATLTVVVNGDSGYATYTYAKNGLNQNRQPWVLESGAWKNDGC